MAGLARFILRHRKLVGLFWALIFIAGIIGAGPANNRLSTDFSLPGQDGYEASKRILEISGVDTLAAPYMLTLTSKDDVPITDAAAADTFAKLRTALPQVMIIDKATAGNADFFSTNDHTSYFAYSFQPLQQGFTSEVREPLQSALSADAPPGTTGQITGMDELALGDSEASEGPGVFAEVLLGGIGALAVLVFVFASLLALLPLVIAAVSILGTFLVLLGLTYISDVSFIVQFLVSLVGLGVAIDYSLLIVTRWREERDHGRDNHDAVVAAMKTAGHAVVFSGLTVAVGLLALVVLPVPFLRSIGYGGMLIPLVSVAVTTTLLPAILGGIGPRIDWPKVRHENRASKFWTKWGEWVVRRRWIAAIVAMAILVALFVPAFWLQIGTAQSSSLAATGKAYDAIQELEQGGVVKGAMTPISLLVNTTEADAVATQLRSVDGVVATFVASNPLDQGPGQSLVFAVPREETTNGSTIDTVDDVKDAVKNNPAVEGVSGIGALQLDYLHGVYSYAPWAVLMILILTYVLLARAFRSLLLPLKAVILNIVSLAATFGAMVLFWQYGFGSEQLYGIDETGAITFWLPLMVFAFLFGLSMDYEVFVLARMREEYDATGSTKNAVIVGLGRTGRLVTSAALILFLAFMALSTGPSTDVKLFATGLGFGILLDATIVRMLLVPALVSLFGEWNWHLPTGVAKLLRVEPSITVGKGASQSKQLAMNPPKLLEDEML